MRDWFGNETKLYVWSSLEQGSLPHENYLRISFTRFEAIYGELRDDLNK